MSLKIIVKFTTKGLTSDELLSNDRRGKQIRRSISQQYFSGAKTSDWRGVRKRDISDKSPDINIEVTRTMKFCLSQSVLF